MRKATGIIVAVVLAVGAVLAAKPADAREKRLVFNLVGTGQAYASTVPDIDGDGRRDPAECFAVDLVDGKTNRKIGTAVDCLSNVQDADNGGLKLIGTSYFHMRGGKLVTRGATTVQPVNAPTATPAGVPITHITGAAATGNSVLYGTGRFRGAKGDVRLSGMVNMSNVEAGEIFFDCLFVIDLHRGGRRWR